MLGFLKIPFVHNRVHVCVQPPRELHLVNKLKQTSNICKHICGIYYGSFIDGQCLAGLTHMFARNNHVPIATLFFDSFECKSTCSTQPYEI